jgi:hypothetical protein
MTHLQRCKSLCEHAHQKLRHQDLQRRRKVILRLVLWCLGWTSWRRRRPRRDRCRWRRTRYLRSRSGVVTQNTKFLQNMVGRHKICRPTKIGALLFLSPNKISVVRNKKKQIYGTIMSKCLRLNDCPFQETNFNFCGLSSI